MRKISSILFFFCAVFCCYAEIRTVTVLHTTDLHGSPEMPKVVSLIRRQRAIDPGLLIIDCGDLTQGSYEATFDHGASMIHALNAAKYDVFVPGNHDFDYGTDVLKANLARLTGVKALGANLTLDGIPMNGWALFERNGLRIAVIGIVPPYLFQWIALPQLNGVSHTSAEQGVAQVMPAIRDVKPDLVILAIHLGEFSSGRLNENGKVYALASLLKKYPEISLVLAGHTHQTVPGKYVYPGAWLVQPTAHGKDAALIRIAVDTEKRQTVSIESELIPLAGIKPAAMPEEWRENLARAAAGRENVLAELPVDFELTPVKSRKNCGTLAPLCARAIAEYAGTDLAFSSSYSSYTRNRSVREYDLYRLIPFENFITVLTLTQRELDAILNEQNGLTGSAGKSFLVQHRRCPEMKERYTVAFGSYAVSGAGGRFPVLKRIAESGTVERRDLSLTVRDAFRKFLENTDLTKVLSGAKVKGSYQ